MRVPTSVTQSAITEKKKKNNTKKKKTLLVSPCLPSMGEKITEAHLKALHSHNSYSM